MKRAITIIVVISCLYATLYPIIGKDMFMREFLVYAYSLHILALALMVLAFLSLMVEKQKSPPDKILIFFLLWGSYVFLHNLVVTSSEVYFQTYLLVGIAAFLCLNLLLKRGSLRAESLYLPIVVTGMVEATVVLLQVLHLLPSHSSYFTVSGMSMNPNIAAMIMCLSVPASVAWIKVGEKAAIYKGLIVLLLVVAILLTRCRSAVLGLLVVLPFLLIHFKQFLHGKRLRLWIMGLSALLFVFFLIINQQKLESSSGRLFIWKMSAQLIAEKPLTGYGYGYFEKAYNKHQATYFNSGTRSEEEIMKASNTSMAYNDVIEQTVMGGIVGGLLFIACLLLPILIGWKNRKALAMPLSGVVVFALMSLFNFVVSHPILFLFLLLYVAVINGYQTEAQALVIQPTKNRKIPAKNEWWHNSTWIFALVVLAAVVVIYSLPKYSAQRDLVSAQLLMKKGQSKQAGDMLRAIEPRVATSEAFYEVKVNYLLSQRDLGGAISAQKERLRFMSNPFVVMYLAQLAYWHKEYDLAASSMETAVGIEPHLFRPKAMLMALYLRQGDSNKAKDMAKDIVELKPKIDSREVQSFKHQAEAILAGKPVSVTDNLTINM